MAASLLDDNLRSLHECLTAANSASKEQADGIVADISQICINESTDKDIDLCCSILFDKRKGLVSFLSETVTKEEFQTCKQKILEFLSEFIQKIEKKIIPYVFDIKDVCMSLFFRERLTKIKNLSVPVLAKVLELSVGSASAQDLGIDKMVNKFFMELTKSVSKLPASVKESIYVILGLLAEIYPEHMTEYAGKLTDIYLRALKAEMTSKTKKPELTVISGCLEGLASCLVNFTVDEDSSNSYEIFKYARMAIDPDINYTRYDVPRAGLKLFARHSAQFRSQLADDYQGMYNKLKSWSKHNNRDLLHLGTAAMEAFLNQISEVLVTKAKEGKREGAVFKFFVTKFREIMNDSSASSKELSLAIRGYGLLAAPCREFLEQTDVQFMFSEMITKSEQLYLSSEKADVEDKLYSLPSYLEALANIIRELDHVPETYATSIERLMIILAENFPTIHQKQHFVAVKSLLWVLITLMPKGEVFSQVLSGFVYQMLIRTCSHPPVIETEDMTESSQSEQMGNKVTYKDFIEMWDTLFNSPRIKEFSVADISVEMRLALTEEIYNKLIESLLKMLGKLDLTSQSSTEVAQQQEGSSADDPQDVSSDPLHGMQPSKPKDFQIFINLVDFCREVLPEKHYGMFEKWMFLFCHTLILQSTEKPLVSGYYKLLAVCMKIANKLNYFQGMVSLSPVKKEVKMEVDSDQKTDIHQKATCFQLIQKFTKEVLVRMKQYKDDLLAACLTFILTLPKEIVSEQMSSVVPAIQLTLSIGLGYLPLAMIALDALNYWSDTLPPSVIQQYYPQILPCLDSYLKTMDQGADDVSVNTMEMAKGKSGKGRKKLSVRIIKGPKTETKQAFQTQIAEVKQRVMNYLGRLGGEVNHTLLSGCDVCEEAISWDTEQHLRFDVPFIDMKPQIYFDPFLPRIVELATKSGDRQTKVAACELLHSLILLSIGRSATAPGRERFSVAPIYRKIFPSILQLACDVDLVTKQLYEPLLMQLIHWFTKNNKAESEESMALLDAIYDGIIQPNDTALRDFCAICLREFLKWSIKQSKNVEKSPINAKSLLKRLYSYALHPGAFKRLGAALAFNNIYTVFREDNAMVNLYTFQVLVHFVESLAIAHEDELSMGTQTQCKLVLEHMERIMKVKAAVLSKEDKNRTEPKQWSVRKLDIAVRWLMRQCGRPQTECRHACMKLVHQLAPCITGIKSTKDYFQTFYKSEKAAYFIIRFEGKQQKYGLLSCPEITAVDSSFSIQNAVSWFDHYLAALDCYIWTFGENLLTPDDIFQGGGQKQSKLFQAMQHFLSKIVMKDVDEVAGMFPHEPLTDVYTPKERDEYNRTKCTAVVRTLDFFCILVARSPSSIKKLLPPGVLGEDLWDLICMCVVHPSIVGFNLGDVQIIKNLPTEMENLLKVFSAKLPSDILTEMCKQFGSLLQGDRDLLGLLSRPLDDPSTDHVFLQQLVSGYQLLHCVGLLSKIFKGTSLPNLANSLFDFVHKSLICVEGGTKQALTLSPTAHVTAIRLLELSFCLGVQIKKVISGILDQSVIEGSAKGYSQSHGELLFTVFKPTMSVHLAKAMSDTVPVLCEHAKKQSYRVMSIMVTVVDTVSKDKNLRKQIGPSVVTSVVQHWKSISVWCLATTELHSMAMLLLTKLVLLDSKVVTDTGSKHFPEVFDTYLKMLTETKTTLSVKCRMLELLPFFAILQEPHLKKLKRSLDRLVADHFPVKSTDLPESSPQFKDYISAIDRLLTSLELSGSEMLLELLTSIFCRESKHVHETKIQESINRFTKRLPVAKQKSVVDVAYNIFCQEKLYPAEVRRITIEKVALPLLRLVHKSALIEFFTDHMTDLRTAVEAKLVKGSGLENQLTFKLCSFQLLELMYGRLGKEEVFGKSSALNKKFCDVKSEPVDSGKEMTQAIMRTAHAAKGEDVRGENSCTELRRQYHCAAYNLLIAVLSSTQNDAKFYTAFLFKEDEAKGQFVYDNLVDKEKSYEFTSELKAPLSRKKQYVSIRNEVKDSEVQNGETEGGTSSSLHLASQYLADSSLSEDLNQYDFTATPQMSEGSQKEKVLTVRKSSYTDEEDDSDTKVMVEEDYVELEMDDLNQHECMATMIALLKHMQRANIIPLVESGVVPELPAWMKCLNDKLKNPRTHINIKYFIVKLIINTAEIFRPYARDWIRPLTQLIISGPFTSLNYFVIDIIVTIMSWHQVAIPQDTVEDRAMSSRLVEFVMGYVYNDTRPVYRNNLELLKTLLQVWKDRVEVPYSIVYKHLKQPDETKKESCVGIQLMGVVLSCKFPPYAPTAPVDQEKFFITVAQYMKNRYKAVYAATAEVVGMIFKYLADKERQTEGTFHDYVVNLMNSLQQSNPSNFLLCIHRMHLHYPPISDRFMNRLLFVLPNLHAEFRNRCLEVILTRIDTLENVYVELKSKGLLSFLTHRDEETQLIALKIVKSIQTKLQPGEVSELLPLICGFCISPSISCRNVMYDILMWVYDNYREDESDTANDIMQQTKETLLKGLGDEDLQCRLLVQNFWSSESRVPGNTLDRLVAMLEAMYSPVTEKQFLSYATNLVLEMTSKSPDYQREMFESPLEDCKFQDYKVKSSWRQRHAAMTPLFANTMATQSMMEEDESFSGEIRATQDVQQFTATQDASKAPFNWLTGSSLDTFTDYSTVGSETSSSLLFTVGTQDMAIRARLKPSRKPGSGFGRPRAGTSKAPERTSKDEVDSEMSRLKRRFLRDEEQSKAYFIKRHTRLQKMREEAMKEQKSRREHQVTMYRKYRKGDLPDIQIKYSYIIAPLQAVAHRDSTVAKLLFGAIFKGIFAKMDEVKTEREVQETIQEIQKSIGVVLTSSIQYFTPFISCLLDILYSLRSKLNVDVSDVSSAATFGNVQPLGICVLEEQLISQNEDERPSKRGRSEGAVVSRDTRSWIELARLYKSVKDYDVLLGIFSDKIGTQEITKEAVQMEARGDYYKAVKLYNQAMSCEEWDETPPTIEVDMWDESRMECLDNLSQWKELEGVAMSGINSKSINQVWKDTYYQEHYLPYIIRSKVKLMLHGDDDQQPLLTFIDDCMKQPDQKALIESRYCEELALMYIWQGDYDRARHYSTMASQQFLLDWSSTDSLMSVSRRSQLQNLQPLVELREFLSFMELESNFTSAGPANLLIERWQNRSLHPLLDPEVVWDDIVTNRMVYLDHISNKLSSSLVKKEEDAMEEDEEDIFLESKIQLRLKMADSSCQKRNHKLALNILADIHKNYRDKENEILNLEWSHLYAKTHQLSAMTADMDWTNDIFSSILTTIDRLGKFKDSQILRREPGLGRRHFVLMGQAYGLLTKGVLSENCFSSLSDKNSEKIMSMIKVPKLDQREIAKCLVDEGYKQMKTALSYDGRSTRTCRYGLEEAYLAVSQYCNKFLRMAVDDEETEHLSLSKESLKSFPETITVCLLNAMKFDSMEARQRFPRLLQLVEMYPEIRSTFIEKSKQVPCWMFIMWISQMMALLDKPEGSTVHHILTELTENYPQAVVYPFKLSSEGYNITDKKDEAFIASLNDKLGDDQLPLVSKFISALEHMSQPDQIFKDWFDDTRLKFNKKKPDKKAMRQEFQIMYKKVLELNETVGRGASQRSQTEETLSTVDKGKYPKKFAERFKKDVDSCFGKDGEKIMDMTLGKFVNAYKKVYTDMTNEVKGNNLKPPETLKDYCQWLSDFNPSIQGKDLEIPGQYDGVTKPLPEYHIKVVGFDQRVKVMTSIRKPKRITIRGNDEREYHYLVKGGEDLRQDQRIEQLFFLMNQVLESDPACKQRNLKIKTYQVIPMTPRVGLIEWMNNTIPLKDFLYSNLTDQETKFMHSKQGPMHLHTTWIMKLNKDQIPAYMQMYLKYNMTETKRELQKKESCVPWDLSRRAFHKMSTSPEAFHVLRCKCASTHALISICQYILGIGDRHLSNFMVNLKNGEIVGIDFGHAFGSATQFLPIPELMPFRLTRQLRNLMMPLQVHGLMESTMIHTLRALRNNCDLLLNTMDIFVKEPSVDWLINAEKQMNEMKGDESPEEEDVMWYPKEKIEYMKRKLMGDNPVSVTRAELKLGHFKKAAFPAMERVLQGDKRENVRAQLNDTGLSVEQQVAALIDQATDPNILGRVYVGWEPWM
ncbi:DNA-dependent protein kinase catalytic subunit-like [Saccostrea echinata]|uniref:DNA-dependent protein kinase catalytic subunit-like n=1 Tax=Saccostrea echinata TaxID=191078 RepID=UPI002A7FB59F|nr:DNA-dependent protein kinase catalytic subunit-like [Saccostrea echinata]